MVGLSGGEGTLDRRHIRNVLEIDGYINVTDRLIIGRGSRICVGHNAILNVGQMYNTSRLHLVCMNEMQIGKNVLIAWDTTLMDSDMHSIIDLSNNQLIPKSKKVIIDDNVWIGTRSIILKGTYIPSGSIIGAGSVVAGKFHEKNSVIAGNPAKIIKSGFTRYK